MRPLRLVQRQRPDTAITGAGRGMGADITKAAEARDAVRAAVDRFGGINVLVNSAGNFYAGFFEEVSPSTSRCRWRPACSGA